MARCFVIALLLTLPLCIRLGAQSGPPAAQTSPQTPAPGAVRPGLPPRDNARAETGTGKIRGRVFSGENNGALRRAQVSLTAPEANIRRFVTTDADGRYEFSELPAARYSITASKGGYVSLQYGQRRPFEPGRPIALASRQELTDVNMVLPRGSVIAGRVTDEFGEPVAGASIQVQRYQYAPGGQRRLTFGPFGFASTDDLGQFRAFGLMPGEYVVSAVVRAPMMQQGPDPSEGYPPTYYPGTTNVAEAQPISIGLGEELSVQLAVQAARMARIAGTVVDSEGRSVVGASMMLRSTAGGGFIGMGMGTTGTDGSFILGNVPPGEHRIDATTPPRPGGGQREFGSVPLTVAGDDVIGLRVVTGVGATVAGRVVFEGTASKLGGPGGAPRVVTQSADASMVGMPGPFMPGGATEGLIGDDGTFRINGAQGTVFFRPILPPAWTLKSVSLEGENVTDVPYDLKNADLIENLRMVVTDRLTDISGGVADVRGQPVKDYTVLIQPERQLPAGSYPRFIRTLRPDQDGRFRVRGMPPGDYLATAVEALEQGREWDPEYQPKLRDAGRRFSVDEGESMTLDLKLADGL